MHMKEPEISEKPLNIGKRQDELDTRFPNTAISTTVPSTLGYGLLCIQKSIPRTRRAVFSFAVFN